jgi:hypothetical protein
VLNRRSNQTNTVALDPTAVPGLFSLALSVNAETAPPAAGQLRARDGDTLEVQYQAADATRRLRVQADIDSAKPAIAQVASEPDYTDALIRWQTTEPADGLVQYADTAVRFDINRTAYDPAFTTDHEIALADLLPDTVYYFKLTSRDPAGNSVEDDNQGKFFTFRTLKPLQPPYTDTFDTGSTNWQVLAGITDEGTLSLFSSLEWQRGQPNNVLATKAHSGSVCWGTNLGAGAGDFASSDLVSPAILLTNGNSATLRFWHNYDFTEPGGEDQLVIESASVQVTTNNGVAWTVLSAFQDASGGWVDEKIDLTPYLGRVIRLAWHYELFSFATDPRPGWLVDDVAVVVTNIVPGTIVVSNNLAQAVFDIDGPVRRRGQGLTATFTNLPPGDYTVTFADVPFYLTPPEQTNTLAPLSTRVVTGRYTMPDANANGISDLWETNYFGALLTPDQAAADPDRDGASNLDEFLAGTNPTDAISALELSVTNRVTSGTLQLNWPATTGFSYRIEVSTNLADWIPLTDWTRATRTNASRILAPLTNAPAHLFRLQVRP